MTEPLFSWAITPGRFSTGKTLRLGSVAVARVILPMRSRGEPVAYAVAMLLPGFKAGTFDATFETEERAQARAEAAVKSWLDWTQKEI